MSKCPAPFNRQRLSCLCPSATWRLTLRSSGAPTAGHQARSGGTRYIFASPGLASCRCHPLNSNVRRHEYQAMPANERFGRSHQMQSLRSAARHTQASPSPPRARASVSLPRWLASSTAVHRFGSASLQVRVRRRTATPNRVACRTDLTLLMRVASVRFGSENVQMPCSVQPPAFVVPLSVGKVAPNPSFKRSANGRPPGPRGRLAYHCPRGPGVLPLSPA